MKAKRKIIEIDDKLCNGCGQCVPNCAEGAIQIVDGKARLVAELFCDGLGACLGHCPEGALKVTEREADEFDEKAVDEHLKEMGRQPLSHGQQHEAPKPAPAAPAGGGGCPSARLQMFGAPTPCEQANVPSSQSPMRSELAHWPVQIKLVPPTAPFLEGADLLVAADCVPIAYANFHAEFLKGKAVMIGCPKFDDAQFYLEKFTELFKTGKLKSVTTVVMQVPCCQGMLMVVNKALELSGATLPHHKVVITTKGEILSRS